MNEKNISKFYRLSIKDRLHALLRKDFLDHEEVELLSSSLHTIGEDSVDKMIENVIGSMSMPMGLGMNLVVNGKSYLLPMAIEEPSVVAAQSSASKVVANAGGFHATLNESYAIGQVHLRVNGSAHAAIEMLKENEQLIIEHANSFNPNMLARGGGAKSIEVKHLKAFKDEAIVRLHLFVDTKNAMGANLVNSMCEGISPLLEDLIEAKVLLRIISNYNERSVVECSCVIPKELFASDDRSAEEVINGIITASKIADCDPYRAVTHNKGIMNGIDPIAIATGNDWRAIESGAHAYASKSGSYLPLSKWTKNEEGSLVGSISIPLKVGIAGAQQKNNPLSQLSLKLLDVKDASELALVMAAAGLSQNLAALKALVTDGIQSGHMSLHARSIVSAINPPRELYEDILSELITSGEIKTWKAEQILNKKNIHFLKKRSLAHYTDYVFGKIILTGEHSVVYFKHAIAIPVPMRLSAQITPSQQGTRIVIPQWNINYQIKGTSSNKESMEAAAYDVLKTLDLHEEAINIKVISDIPRGSGLGSSAALSFSIINALDNHFGLNLSLSDKNKLTYQSEMRAHGNPSGVDNTVIAYQKPILFRKGYPDLVETFNFNHDFYFVVALTKKVEFTAKTVQSVGERSLKSPNLYESLFDQMDQLTLSAFKAIQSGDTDTLGRIMDINQGLLNAIGVSSPLIEDLLQQGRSRGALGGKLSGSGGGGATLFLANDQAHASSLSMYFKKQGLTSFSFNPKEALND
jgi:hydroxymethylglutaryl-CoA reductase